MINKAEQDRILKKLIELGIKSYFHKDILWIVDQGDMFIVEQVLCYEPCIYKHIEEEYV